MGGGGKTDVLGERQAQCKNHLGLLGVGAALKEKVHARQRGFQLGDDERAGMGSLQIAGGAREGLRCRGV